MGTATSQLKENAKTWKSILPRLPHLSSSSVKTPTGGYRTTGTHPQKNHRCYTKMLFI